jgi:vitamin B12 transporter
MRRRLLPVLLGLVARPVGAQQPSDTALLPPVVVTATRLLTPSDAVPQAITVVSGVDLQARGITTVLEALRGVPSAVLFQTGSFGGQTSLFLRGGESKYVKVLVDGVPVNQPGGAYDFANLTTTNVDRIEILRGPASVLYGSDAVTGVVQIFTQRGGARRAEMTVGQGTYGTVDWAAGASGGDRRAGYSFAVSRLTSDGMYAFNNRYDNTVASALLRAAPDERTDAIVTVRYDDNTYHFPTNGAGVPTDSNQFNFGKGPTIGLDLGRRVTSRLETRLLVTANATEGGYDNQPDGADSSLFHSLDKLRRMGADLRANLSLPAGAVLTAGAAFEGEHDQGSTVCQFAGFDCGTPPVSTSRSNWAGYLQGASPAGQRLSFTAGVRLEDNQRFGTFGTYRGGIAYRFPRGTRLRATLGNAFREPTFFENYSTGFSTGNPDLRPEHSQSWEVGLEQSALNGRLRVSATFFDQRFHDMIDYNPSAAPGAPNYENVAAATARGVELGLEAAPARGFSLAGTYTALYTRATSAGFDSSSGAQFAVGQPLLRRPAQAARLDAGYRWAGRWGGTLSAAVTYVGSREDQDFSTFPAPRVTLPAYARVDATAVIDVVHARGVTPGVSASTRIENLFDLSYEEVKNFPARRRTVFVGAKLLFAY